MRPIPVMLALLLALSPGAVAFQASAPTAQPPSPAQDVTQAGESTFAQSDQPVFAQTDQSSDGNTTNVMTLGTDPDRTAFAEPSLALGSALTSDYDSVQTQLSVNSLDEQLANAGSSEEKKRLLNRYRYQIENRIISLQAREERVTNDFANGTLSEREYLRALGQIDAEAEEVRGMVDAMRTRTNDIRGFNVDTKTLQGKLALVEGPVRDQIGRAIRGQAVVSEIYVATSSGSVVLSTIDSDTYVREVLRGDRRDPSETLRLSPIEAQQSVRTKYPWADANLEEANTIQYGSTNIISVSIRHEHGELVTYVDGGTEEIFREIQYKQLVGEHSLSPEPNVNNTSENLTLTVSRTYAGGPLRAKLTNETGAPLQGEISIDGEPAGRTSDNGVLWTLGPTSRFQVSATYDGRTVNVTTTPTSAGTPGNVSVEPVNVSSPPIHSP